MGKEERVECLEIKVNGRTVKEGLVAGEGEGHFLSLTTASRTVMGLIITVLIAVKLSGK